MIGFIMIGILPIEVVATFRTPSRFENPKDKPGSLKKTAVAQVLV